VSVFLLLIELLDFVSRFARFSATQCGVASIHLAKTPDRTTAAAFAHYAPGESIADSAGWQHGFLKDGASFIQVDFPGSTLTSLTGINSAGEMAGSYEDGTGFFYPFVTDLSTFTRIDFPFCGNSCSGSAHGPNGGGVLVGLVFDLQGVGHGFIARPTSQ
jgi:hypothetical protein